MDKKSINTLIPLAYSALKTVKIADEEDKIKKTYRGQIATFGAAITMGSIIAAVAFFSNQGGSDVDRTKIMDALLIMLKENGNCTNENIRMLFEYIKDPGKSEEIKKEEIINASIALKMAMNLYTLEK